MTNSILAHPRFLKYKEEYLLFKVIGVQATFTNLTDVNAGCTNFTDNNTEVDFYATNFVVYPF